jgi:hypothetical protein
LDEGKDLIIPRCCPGMANPGKPMEIGETKEFKMTLQYQGMKIDGVIRDKIEGKKLKELIDKAVK